MQAYNLAGSVDVALESPAGRVDPRRAPRVRVTHAAHPSRRAATCLAAATLLVIVSVSMADGLLTGSVAYERDTTVFYFPLLSWAAQQLRQGSLPLWTPQFFGGYPIFADGESGLAYPPVLLALLWLPVDRAFVALRLLHFWIAALGGFALARAWDLPRTSAVLAGLVVVLGSFLQAQVHHENIIRTAAWLPVILALVERGLRAPDWRRQLRWTVGASLALGLAGLSLHSQMLAIDLLVLGVYGLMRWLVGPVGGMGTGSQPAWLARAWVVLSVCGVVVVLGLGLAAVQIVPLAELARFSRRGSGIPYAESAAYSLTVPGLAQLVFPFLFHGPGDLRWGLWTHWESYLYIGLVPLLLGIVGLLCVRRRELALWVVLGGLGLLLALGQYSPINLHYFLWLLPGLSGLRAPGRFASVVVLAGGMLAAYGLAWLTAQAQRPPQARASHWLVGVLAGLAGCVVVLAGGVLSLHAALLAGPDAAADVIQSSYLSLPRDTYPLSEADVYSGLNWATDIGNPRVLGALLGLGLGVLLLAVWQLACRPAARAWRGWPVVFVAASACDLLLFGWGIHPRAPLAVLSAAPGAVRAIEQQPWSDGVPPRVLASPVLSQVAADRLAPFRIQEANGYSSLQFSWHQDYLSRVLFVDDVLLDLWNVRYVIGPARFGTLAEYRGVEFLPQQALLYAPSGSATSQASFSLDPSRPVHELRFVTAMMGAVDVAQDTPVAIVQLRDASGRVLAERQVLAGRDSMEWAADLPNVRPQLQHQRVESAGLAWDNGPPPNERVLSFGDLVLDVPVQASSLSVQIVLPRGELTIYGMAAVDPSGGIQQLFARTKAKYRPLYADAELSVQENTAALPRAFLLDSATVAPSVGSMLGEMVHRPFDPRHQVILAADSDQVAQVAASVANTGDEPGTVQVTSYAPDRIWLHTSAASNALLVLTDTYYPGWSARVDGQPEPVVRGDVLFRVVPVPAGEHDLELSFEPLSVQLGLLVSVASAGLAIAALVLSGARRRRGRTTK